MGNFGFGKAAGSARIRGAALASVSIIPLLAAAPALAQPVGGTVVAGQARISAAGANTVVNQASAKAIINWQDFSLPSGASVTFNQPSSSAITLNRVTGSALSTIDGAIRANGQVWLLNPNGLLFGQGASINVGGLLATTADIANQDFLDGRYNFRGGRGAITNNGTIKAASGGSVILSAPNVANRGLIQADAGHVVLGGTDTFTVDFDGDHLLSYAVGANSSGGQVTNSGAIKAAGGKVLLTARAAQGVQDAVVNNSGMVEASSAREENGEIVLEADGGTAVNSGSLDASGKAQGASGGTVKVLGQQVALADGAKIDVSGDAGGGTALIGGNFHGQGSEIHAQNTTVGNASIDADAVTAGDGGKVAVWSDGTTRFAGHVSARGGAASGNGGQVETSGHYLGVDRAATVTTSAPYGTPGDWLLDPNNLTIVTGGSGTVTGETFATNTNDTIDPSTIVAGLANGNVTLQANIDITVNNAISTTTTHTLELDAGHSIILNANINLNAAGSGADASSAVILSANDVRGTGNGATSSITEANGSDIYAGNIRLTLAGTTSGIGSSGSPFVIDYADDSTSGSTDTLVLTVGSGSDVFLTSLADNTQISATGAHVAGNTFSLTAMNGTILQASGGSITAGTLKLQTLTAGTGIGTSAAPINVAAPSGTLALTLVSTGDPVFINSTSPVSLATVNTVNVTNGGTGDFSLASSSAISQAVATSISVNNLTITGAPSSVTLANSGNAIAGTAGFHTSGNVNFTNSVATTLGTSTISGGGLTLSSGGAVTQTGALTMSGNLAVTASSSTITLTNTGNAISGTLHLASSGNASFTNGASVSTTTLGASTISGGDLSVTALGATLDLTDTSGAVSANNVTLQAANFIDQAFFGANLPIVTSNLTATATNTTGSLRLLDAGGGLNNAVSGTVTLNAGTSGGIGFSNTLPTTLNGIGAVTLDIEVSDPSGQTMPGITLNGQMNGTSSVTLSAAGNINTQDASITTPSLSLSSQGGSIGLGTGSPAFVGNGSSPISLSVNNLSTGSAYIRSSSPVTVTNASLSAGAFDLRASGDITVSGPITTSGQYINLASQGSLILNANLSDPGGTIFLDANSSFLGNSAASITGTGTISADDVAIELDGDTSGTDTGTIGLATQSLNLATTASSLNLQVTTAGQSAYVSAHGAVLISSVDSILAISGVQLSNGGPVTGGFLLNATGPVSESGSDHITATDLTVATTGSGSNITLANDTIGGTVRFFTAAGANVSYTNSNPVTLGNSNVGGNLDIEATGSTQFISLADSAGSVTAGGLLTLNSGSGITQNIPISTGGGLIANAGFGNLTLTNSANVISGTASLITTGSSVSLVNSVATTLGTSASGSDFTVQSGGSITVASGAAIVSNGSFAPNQVNLDAGGSIFINGTVAGITNSSGPGTILLTANDPNLSGNSDSNGIFGSGDLLASTIGLKAAAGQNGQSGGIGALTQPLILGSDAGAVSLSVTTNNGNVYLFSGNPVSIDNPGVNTRGASGNYGGFDLVAVGPINQTWGIQSGNLTVNSIGASSGPAGLINLNDVNQIEDPGNTIFGTVHLLSSGDANFAGNGVTNLGASQVAGNLSVSSPFGDLNVADPNGAGVVANGAISLFAATPHHVTISSPLISGTNMTLTADYVTQNAGGGSSAFIQVGGNLYVQSAFQISLNDPGSGSCSSGTACSLDPGNQVSGTLTLQSGGNASFSGSGTVTLANDVNSYPSSAGGLFSIATSGNIVIAPGASIQSQASSGPAILLKAGGSFINNSGLGQGTFSLPNGANWQIYSANPTQDQFGGLNSNNSAVYSTSYQATTSASGNRYIFAFQPTLTISLGSATKVYGTDDSAALQSGYTISGLQPGLSGVYLGDASSIISGAPLLASTGSAAGAGVGSYAITGSAGSLAAAGYALSFQPGNLTVTPATLTYVAGAASRPAGLANPIFTGTVTGFVNGDTLASSTSGTLLFTSPATADSPPGSYAITGSGLSASNYVFTQAASNATALTITDQAPVLPLITNFTASIQPPPLSNILPVLGNALTAVTAPPPVVTPPPVPPPPPLQLSAAPLADLEGSDAQNAEPPTPSDQVTLYVANSLEGGPPPPPRTQGAGSTVIIPRYLNVQPLPPTGTLTDSSLLSGFGNISLWQ